MNFQTESPTAPPPTAKKTYPWTKRVNYKSGKVAAAFAEKAEPKDVNAGFTYYDSDAKANITLEEFSAVVVASLSGIAGVTKEGDKYYNYYSNLVRETRQEILEVRMHGIDKPLHTGLYADIKPELPQGVGYTQVLICYVPGYDQFMSINLTVGLQQHLKSAIAKATNSPVKKINLFSLCDLTTQYWGFYFTGRFVKIDKEGNLYAGHGEIYFMPEVTVFVVNEKPETTHEFEVLNAGSKACSDYVQAEQDRIYGAEPKRSTEVPVSAEMSVAASVVRSAGWQPKASMPTTDITTYPEDPNGDDLPF